MTCITGSTFAYASAQAVCAVSVCSEASSHSNIAMILDAGLLLASIIILLAVLFAIPSRLQHRNMTSPFPCLPSQS